MFCHPWMLNGLSSGQAGTTSSMRHLMAVQSEAGSPLEQPAGRQGRLVGLQQPQRPDVKPVLCQRLVHALRVTAGFRFPFYLYYDKAKFGACFIILLKSSVNFLCCIQFLQIRRVNAFVVGLQAQHGVHTI